MTSEDIRADYVWRTMEAMGTIWSDDHCGHVTRQMAKEIAQLRRVVEALREPSETVLQAAGHEVLRYVDPNEGDMRSAIIAAVAAAEREASHD